eukprot:Awhi_evm1s11787
MPIAIQQQMDYSSNTSNMGMVYGNVYSHQRKTGPSINQIEKRNMHNELERKRREELKKVVPELDAKTPKVAILSKSIEYIQELKAEHDLKVKQRESLREEFNRLTRRLEILTAFA